MKASKLAAAKATDSPPGRVFRMSSIGVVGCVAAPLLRLLVWQATLVLQREEFLTQPAVIAMQVTLRATERAIGRLAAPRVELLLAVVGCDGDRKEGEEEEEVQTTIGDALHIFLVL